MTLLGIALAYAIAVSLALARKAPVGRRSASGSLAGQAGLRLLVVGATGGTGRKLVEQAVQRGYHVTALARNPSKLEIAHPRLTVMQGDVMDYTSLEPALRGQHAVVCALGHKRWFSTNRILSEGTRNLLRAMEAHAVARLICETSLGVGSSSGRMGLYYTLLVIPFILPLYFYDKVRQEKAVAASQVDWVIVRPGALIDAAPRGVSRHGAGVGSFLWTVRISRADVASFMLDQLTDVRYLGLATGVCW